MQIFVNKNLQYVKVIALAAPLTCHLCDFAFVDGTARARTSYSKHSIAGTVLCGIK